MGETISDRIEVRGLELLVFCGVLPEEQARKQPFLFDLDMYMDLSVAGRTDDLADTANYGAIVDLLAAKLDVERFALLERMSVRIADLIFENSAVQEVTVTARKLRPPVAAHVDTTGVRIHRVRPQ